MFFLFGDFSVCIEQVELLQDLLSDKWQRFAQNNSASENADVLIVIKTEEIHKDPSLLNMNDYSLCHDSSGWHAYTNGNRWEVSYYTNGKKLFLLRCNSDKKTGIVVSEYMNKSSLRLGIQFSLMIGLHRECVGLHGVTLLCRDRIFILSAPSGTGKSTLASLLERYEEALVINGDFALLSYSDEGVMFEPTPFCGSSNRCLNHRVRVDCVVFLEQSETNEWKRLSGRQAFIHFMNNVFVPSWSREMAYVTEKNVIELISRLTVSQYAFAPFREAAEVFAYQLEKES